MSSEIKCGKCGIIFDKEPNPRRKNDHYRSCKTSRDKLTTYKQNKKPVKHETGQINDSNWKQVVFKDKPKSEIEADKSDIESEAESDKSDISNKSDNSKTSNKTNKSNTYDANPIK